MPMKLLNRADIALISETELLPAGRQRLTQLPVVIMVGLTGVGKSTTLSWLQKMALTVTLLPNRREVTDEVMIAPLQRALGQTPQPVTDRLERFEYTARYRAQYPGGMAHALSQLAFKPDRPNIIVIFDGLRGLNEVKYAAAHFSQARFVVLDAPDLVRLQRLLERGDHFDRAALPAMPVNEDLITALKTVDKIETIFSQARLAQVAHIVQAAGISTETALAKITIIVKERLNYDSNSARAYLTQTLPPERVLVVDTAQDEAQAVAQQIGAWLGLESSLYSYAKDC